MIILMKVCASSKISGVRPFTTCHQRPREKSGRRRSTCMLLTINRITVFARGTSVSEMKQNLQIHKPKILLLTHGATAFFFFFFFLLFFLGFF